MFCLLALLLVVCYCVCSFVVVRCLFCGLLFVVCSSSMRVVCCLTVVAWMMFVGSRRVFVIGLLLLVVR